MHKWETWIKAVRNFKKVMDKVTEPKTEHDANAWIEWGQLLEKTDPRGALVVYQKVSKLLKAKDQSATNMELDNNIGAMQFVVGDYSESEQTFRNLVAYFEDTESLRNKTNTESESNTDNEKLEEDKKVKQVTVRYNLARILEQRRKYKEALEIYESIIEQYPKYLDCYLRMGCISQSKGKYNEAIEHWNKVLELDPDNAEARSLLGNLYTSREQWRLAQTEFETLLNRDKTSKDPYAMLALGNIYYNAKWDKRDTSSQEKCLNHAFEQYSRVLLRNPKNIYAANGLGIVFAEKGYFTPAIDVFSKVKESPASVSTTNSSSSSLSASTSSSTSKGSSSLANTSASESSELNGEVWVNLGHSYLGQKQYMSAIKMYQLALKKFYKETDDEIYLFIAKAQFEMEKYDDAKRTLMKALHINPQSTTLWFNLALVQEYQAKQVIIHKKFDSKTIEEEDSGLLTVLG